MLPLLLNRKLIVALKIELYDRNRPVNLTIVPDLLCLWMWKIIRPRKFYNSVYM